jgi:flagellar assembly factor FliW
MVGNNTLAFLVVSPFEVLPSYQPNISTDDIESLGIRNPEDALLYTIVTLRSEDRTTANLKGPIVINRHTLIGKQVVIVNASEYPVQYPLTTASST